MPSITRREVIAGAAALAVTSATAHDLVERQRIMEIRDRLERAWRAQGALAGPDRIVVTVSECERLPMAAGLRGSYCVAILRGRLEIRPGCLAVTNLQRSPPPVTILQQAYKFAARTPSNNDFAAWITILQQRRAIEHYCEPQVECDS